MKAINDFLAIHHIDNVYQITPIKKWLNTYKEFYQTTYDVLSKSDLFETSEGIIRLPYICNPSIEEKFIELYDKIEEIVNYQKLENDCFIRMSKYHKISNSKKEINKWLLSNKDIVSSVYSCFLIDYLDYANNTKHLLLNTELVIYIDRKYFINTIEFIEIINNLTS